eukprot:493200_1
MDENAIRAGWKTNSRCQIYSNSKKKWFFGEVAQIFTDEEGEWLEVRYDKSMSKQVQRYSSDIRPHPDDVKAKKKAQTKPKASETPAGFDSQETKSQQFPDKERQLRQSWTKGDEVEIFSNTHQEWYLGEVVDIVKDDEGEWLTCVWARPNNEAMSKQVQRFSTDVRPVQDDSSTGSDSDDEGVISNNKHSHKPTDVEKKKILAQQIASRKTNFRRRAPPFSRTLRTSTFTYPASKMARQTKKLNDLEETNETNQHVVDAMPHNKRVKVDDIESTSDIESMGPKEVRVFIRSFGRAYERYVKQFFRMTGKQVLQQTEESLTRIGVDKKLHRNKILLEIHRHSPGMEEYQSLFNHEVEVLNWHASQVAEWCSKTQVLNTKNYADRFKKHGVDGMLLFELDLVDLKVIGIEKADRNRVLDIISNFARKKFPSNDDEKDEESSKNGSDNNELMLSNEGGGKKKRGSVAHIDVSKLQQNGGINNIMGHQNNDAIIYTMGELLLELGQMFKVGKVQDLTTRLQEQLNELQRNSNHPQMLKRQSQNLKIDVNGGSNNNNTKPISPDVSLMKKMQDHVDTSPTGVDAAWIKTQNQAKGHKRRSSLPYNSLSARHLDDEDDDEDDISDIE